MSNDRNDIAQARHGSRSPVTLMLIAVNVAMFVFQNAADSGAFPVYKEFALSIDGLKHGHFWQVITFQFLHLPLNDGGIFHLLGNLFVIHVFGKRIEETMGGTNFLKLYLLSGTMGGMLQMAGGWLSPENFGVAVVGASAGAFGLIAAYGTLFPREQLRPFFLPVAIRADVLLALGVTITVAELFLPSGHVAHCAHLGGILTGFLFARQVIRRNPAPAMAAVESKSSLNTIPAPD
jgi:membrane associated rhomboid family serine protease